jgi:hypothetical protein
MTRLQTLIDMHTFCRPLGSATESRFIARYIAPLPGAYQDVFRNWHCTIGVNPIVLWSCHTDTVHRTEGRQTVHYDQQSGMLQLSRRSRRRASCLGADDTAGVFLLREMILAGVTGHYIFHYGEERGGIGSRAIAAKHREWLQGFSMAIAVDRGGTCDVITHQGSRTASDAFADSLANTLNMQDDRFTYVPCDRGIYTDTREYADDIAECTNISVGYGHAHSPMEYLDVPHVMYLCDALCKIDVSTLMIARDPFAPEPIVVQWPATWDDLDDDDRDDNTYLDRLYLDRVFGDVQRAIKKGWPV